MHAITSWHGMLTDVINKGRGEPIYFEHRMNVEALMRPCEVQIHVNLFLSKDSAPLLASAAARPRDEPLTGTLTKETSPYLYCVPANAGDEPHLQKLSFSPKYTSRRERDRRPAAQPSRAKAGLPPSSRASSVGDAAAALAPPRTASRSCA